MGAWRSIRHRLDDAARSSSSVAGVTYVGRSWRASPSEGYPTAHQREQDRIVRVALGVALATARRELSASCAASRACGRRRGGGHLGPVRPCRLSRSRRCAGESLRHMPYANEPRSHRIRRKQARHRHLWWQMPTRSLWTRCCTFRRFRPLRSGMASDRVAPDPVPEPGGSMPVETAPRTRSFTFRQRHPGPPRTEEAERRARRRDAARSLPDRGSVREPSAVQVRGAGTLRGDTRRRARRRAPFARAAVARRGHGREPPLRKARRSMATSGAARATSTGASDLSATRI